MPGYSGYSSRPETSAAISRIQARHNPPPSNDPAAPHSCPDLQASAAADVQFDPKAVQELQNDILWLRPEVSCIAVSCTQPAQPTALSRLTRARHCCLTVSISRPHYLIPNVTLAHSRYLSLAVSSALSACRAVSRAPSRTSTLLVIVSVAHTIGDRVCCSHYW